MKTLSAPLAPRRGSLDRPVSARRPAAPIMRAPISPMIWPRAAAPDAARVVRAALAAALLIVVFTLLIGGLA